MKNNNILIWVEWTNSYAIILFVRACRIVDYIVSKSSMGRQNLMNSSKIRRRNNKYLITICCKFFSVFFFLKNYFVQKNFGMPKISSKNYWTLKSIERFDEDRTKDEWKRKISECLLVRFKCFFFFVVKCALAIEFIIWILDVLLGAGRLKFE